MLNKRGAALLQVLIISAVLAGLSAMILRATLSRTLSARRNRHTISAQMVIENAMAQINARWASLTPETYAKYLDLCILKCDEDDVAECNNEDNRIENITVPGADGNTHSVTVKFEKENETGKCVAEYSIENGTNL